MTNALIILGNQLFPIEHIRKIKPDCVYMREDYQLCTFQKHHKHKITLFLSAMRSYKDDLISSNFDVHYHDLNPCLTGTYRSYLSKFIKEKKIQEISFFEIEDKWFEKEMLRLKKECNIKVNIIKTPMFITNRDEFLELSPPSKTLPKYKMASFYIAQRKKTNILIENGKPKGGKWSHDKENRKKIPKNIDVPIFRNIKDTTHTKDIKKIINKVFPDNYGETDDFNYPTTRKAALTMLDQFISEKLNEFGDYEDSVDGRSPFWFHSVLSPLLNIGLITPDDIIPRVLKKKDIKVNSYEGFIRQIIGWREFMRGIYQQDAKIMSNSNFFGNNRKMKNSWYDGSTGLLPLDQSIKSTLKYSYAHHIERLMIQANIMNLCEIDPKIVYNWFMEMYIDSSDWVMTPNVYSMGLFADGGIMATKPYLCGSNYMLKMMDFKKGDWCKVLDGLYWRFIDKHLKFFKSNPRLSMMAAILGKMDKKRKDELFILADNFIKENTKS